MSDSNNTDVYEQIPSGVAGFDFILKGGLPRGKTYFVQGDPGAGKTTLGLQFVRAGAANGERALYVTISQSAADLYEIARSHGWDLEGVEVVELSRQSVTQQIEQQQTLLRTEDVELREMSEAIRDVVDEARPQRLVFDSIGAIRVLAGGVGQRYRREINLLLQLLDENQITALILDDITPGADDIQFQTLAHGVFRMFYESSVYSDKRMLRVVKVRGLQYHEGQHSYQIKRGGLILYPALVADHTMPYEEWRTLTSGVPKLDAMLGGGLEMGSACLIIGPTGAGKSTVASLFIHTALHQGERAAVMLFDERAATFLHRSEMLQMDLAPYVANGQLQLREIRSGEVSASEFAHEMRLAVAEGTSVVLIDSLTGYYHTMQHEETLRNQMHELLSYLSHHGVLSLLVVAQEGITGGNEYTPVNISYMADTVILLHLYEHGGQMHKALSIMKKRHGGHEQIIRDLNFTDEGLRLGQPVEELDGILSGQPTFKPDRTSQVNDLEATALDGDGR